MRRIKLIAGLFSLGALVTTAPIFQTSCSTKTNKKLEIELDSNIATVGYEVALYASLVDKDGNLAKINRINCAKSSDKNILEVYGALISATKSAIINVCGIKKGTATLTLNFTDENGNTIESNFEINSIKPAVWTNLKAVEDTGVIIEDNKITYLSEGEDVDGKFTITSSEDIVKSDGGNINWTILSNGIVDHKMSVSLGKDNRTLTVTIDKTHGSVKDELIEIKCSGAKQTVLDFNAELDATVYSTMVYAGMKYVLAADINPNSFISRASAGGMWIAQTIKLKNGSEITISNSDQWNQITKLNLSLCDPAITSIGDAFLDYCMRVESISLGGLQNITTIGDEFLNYCANTKEVDLSGLTSLETIGYSAISSIHSLRSIDLSPLKKLKTIGNNFCQSCSSLCNVSILNLPNLTSIGERFFSNCSELVDVKIQELPCLEEIGDYFFSTNSVLANIKFSGIPKLKTIGESFLSPCVSLESIDLSAFTGLESTDRDFLGNCTALKNVNLNGLSNLTEIKGSFLNNCIALKSIDLSALKNLKSIGYSFLYNCPGISYVDLTPLTNVTSVGDYFLSHCSSLTSIDLSPLSNVESIGMGFLSYCRKLTAIDVSPLSKITDIPHDFLSYCGRLISLDLSSFRNVKTIRNEMLMDCTSLETLDLRGISQLEKIEYGFLENCTGLKTVYLFDESPKNFETSASRFMLNVTANCNFYTTNEFIGDYQTTSPWVDWSNSIKVLE